MGKPARVAMVLALGAVAALGQAPWGLWPLTVVALALVYGRYRQADGWRAAAWLGWGVGTGHFLLAFHWITEPFMVDAARHGWMAPFALVGLAAVAALYWGAGMALARAQAAGLRSLSPGWGWPRPRAAGSSPAFPGRSRGMC